MLGTTFPVVWIDNFSKNVARQRPTVSKGVFTSMMWTGIAVKLYDGPALSRDLVYVNGDLLTAMPPAHAPLEAAFVATALAAMPFEEGRPPMRFRDSLVNRYQVCSIPPKVEVDKEESPILQQRLSVSRDGLHRTLPLDIWKHNIGSNTGLIDVIQEYVTTTELHDGSQYHVWLVDVNIYSRVYKVCCLFASTYRSNVSPCPQFMYDHSGIGKMLHSKVFLALGLWHNFKQASLILWKRYALDFIGPAYHCLFPGRDMYMNPRLVHVTTMFTYLRLSYPRWRDALHSLRTKPDLPPSSVNHLHNLTMLMEFFIPTVHPESLTM